MIPRQASKLGVTQSIVTIIMLVIAVSLLTGCPGSTSPFNYQVQVIDAETREPIKDAQVMIFVGGKIAPLDDYTDSEGFAIIPIDASRAGQLGKLTVTAPDYIGYSRSINLDKGKLPDIIPLERETGGTKPQHTATPIPSAPAKPPTPLPPEEHTLTPDILPTDPPTPEPIPTNTSLPEPPIANTATPLRPTSPPSSQADAVVLTGGASLRPGADTWWYARDTLPAGTELKLVGYDPNFAGWVYACTVDGAKTGWAQTASLQVNVQLSTLPRVTPRPTLTATPVGAGQSTPSGGCSGGPLTLTFYYDPGSERCTSGSGWAVNLHFIVSGGNCTYTYYWENQLIYGPTTQSELIYTVEHGSAALVGNGEVRSGSESVKQGIYVDRPNCP